MWRGYPLIMGILNVTPDSFSDAGRYADSDRAYRRGCRMVREGADIIDVGGESTRPGASPVAIDEELRRVIPVIRRLKKTVKVPISVDTSKAEVARQAIEAGASIINDVTALRSDKRMVEVIARYKPAVVLMHMQGTPRSMQRSPRYRDVAGEIRKFLMNRARILTKAGIARSRIIIDPGLGFGKTVWHNLLLMRSLEEFVKTGFPVLIGPSRKSFIGKVLQADLGQRLAGTLACVARAFRAGVCAVRVHDVLEASRLIGMLRAIEDSGRAKTEPYVACGDFEKQCCLA